jgi:hypothetical protein
MYIHGYAPAYKGGGKQDEYFQLLNIIIISGRPKISWPQTLLNDFRIFSHPPYFHRERGFTATAVLPFLAIIAAACMRRMTTTRRVLPILLQ